LKDSYGVFSTAPRILSLANAFKQSTAASAAN
jgi:hypothetical protein